MKGTVLVKVIKSGDEYKVLKSKSKIKLLVGILSLAWFLGLVIPSLVYLNKHADVFKKYVVVKGVYSANKFLSDQYDVLASNLVKNINISKYTSKIKIPEVKLDGIATRANKVSSGAKFLSRFGVKGAGKVADQSDVLKKQVDKINNNIKNETAKLRNALEKDLDSSIKKEIEQFGKSELKKQLKLSGKNYANLLADRYGFTTPYNRAVTISIYSDLQDNKSIGQVSSVISKYFSYIYWTVFLLILIVGFIPVFIMFKIAKMFTDNFTKCPHCGKVFISKTAKFNIFSKLRFWE